MEKQANLAGCDSSGTKPESKELLIDIPLTLEPAEWPECCISRIPKKLRNVNEEPYTPKLVAIGPFHHGKEEFRKMEIQKLRYLREFCYRTGNRLVELKSIIAENEVRIRHCYSEISELSSDEFVNMIVLDAVFIINLFWWRSQNNNKDIISRRPLLEVGIRHDLMLLENQLPFFVLEKLYEVGPQIEIEKDGKKFSGSFLEVSLHYFSAYLKTHLETKIPEAKHFTDLLRKALCLQREGKVRKPVEVNGGRGGVTQNLYCAKKLQRAGLKFKERKESFLLEIEFPQYWWLKCFPFFDVSWLLTCLPCVKSSRFLDRMQHILKVPPFEIDDDTEALIRNLMALEQCHYPSEAFFCNYILLLDSLVESEQDIDLLVDKGVIVNSLGSNSTLVTLINKLGHNIVVENSCFSHLSLMLNKYYESPLNHTVAALASTYFEDFWKGTATVVGLIVLAFTLWDFVRPYVFK